MTTASSSDSVEESPFTTSAAWEEGEGKMPADQVFANLDILAEEFANIRQEEGYHTRNEHR